MKKILLLVVILTSFISCETLKQLPGAPGGGLYSEQEAGDAIKEALAQGLTKAVLGLNKEDGFFGSDLYKILLPAEALKIEKTLRSLGMNQMVDKAILQINRGAEDAVGYAKPIFVEAIKSMTLQDAIGLVKNGDTSATHFFREKTTDKLITAFMPVIKSSLDKTSATRYYGDMVKTYNDFPTTIKKLNPDLAGFVCLKATDALFDMVAKEEQNIRKNPLARGTELLKKVFGSVF